MAFLCDRAPPCVPVSRSAAQSLQQVLLCHRQPIASPLFTSSSRRSHTCRKQLAAGRRSLIARAGDWNPPTVADTKRRFYESFRRPVAGIYNNVIQELLVQQHIMRYNKKYSYDAVFGLGFVSVFDQVLEGLPEGDKGSLFAAYLTSLEEDPKQFRVDADKLEAWASGLSGPGDLKPDGSGDEVQQKLAGIAEKAAAGNFLYTKFFAIGLFRLLELTGAKDPKALEMLVAAMNISQESVNRDLMTYKGVLSKLSAAKELMGEILEREKRKAAEREAEKKSVAEGAKEKEEAPASNVVAS